MKDENINAITILEKNDKENVIFSDYIYSGLVDLKQIWMYDNVKTLVIGKKSCYGCSTLNTINLSNNLETLIIDDYAFEYSYYHFYNYFLNDKNNLLPNLKYLKLGKGVFNNNVSSTKIEKFIIPENVETLILDNYTFENCKDLTHFILNDNLKNLTIGNQTFDGCNKLTKIKIPQNTKVTTLHDDDKCNNFLIYNKVQILEYNKKKDLFSNIFYFFIDLISVY
jgi:hypothetical protein